MATSNIDVKILAEFLGKNAFKQAETATAKLTRSVNRLGSAFGLSLGVYGAKAMAQAFIEDSKAAAVLANSLKNVGLAFNQTGAEQFIKAMQDQTTILDDQLRPAYAQLAQTTGSVVKTQELMQLAFDASRGSGLDFTSTVDVLTKAYVGNVKGLQQLKLGLTQAELKSMTFAEIQDKIATTFKGAGKASLTGYAYEWDNLNVKIADAKELLGKNILDALSAFSGESGAGGAGRAVEKLAGGISSTVTGITNLTKNVKIAAPVLVAAGAAIMAAWAPWLTAIGLAAIVIGKIGNMLPKTPQEPLNKTGKLFFPSSDASISLKIRADQKKAEQEAIKRNQQLAKLIQDQAKAAKDALLAKKLSNAIDKANLALNKSSTVFDLDKIQLAAAEQNQVEQLGKATTQSQLLAITNDLARLRVKQDIKNLEDAIASGDIKAIEAATAKLNEDTKILGVLTNQSLKLTEIKTTLEAIVPADLINISNLDTAIAKLRIIASGFTGGSSASASATTNDLLMAGSFVPVVAGTGGVMGGSSNAGAYASSGFPGSDKGYGTPVNITVNTGVGDPNAIAEAITQVVREAQQRGTLTGAMGTL